MYGDFISKASDILWNKGALSDVETEENAALGSYQNSVEVCRIYLRKIFMYDIWKTLIES